MTTFTEMLTTIGVALITLGIISVLVSKKAQTPQVVQSIASGFNNALGVAEAPVTGADYSVDLSYPHGGF